MKAHQARLYDVFVDHGEQYQIHAYRWHGERFDLLLLIPDTGEFEWFTFDADEDLDIRRPTNPERD